ncbi:hypothetical protein [Comamonas testosteroni]|uniref:hypothetical protein n=1 Tax=Comamonas testosteroni TaxID=285 RepID=UPI00128FB2DC|nr:hypothetical protein [Comamonas testosteroni]
MSYRREDYCPTTGEPCQSLCETPCGSHQRTVGELAMLVRQLVHSLRKSSPDNEMCTRALDYLKRKGLAGTFLRGNSSFASENVPSELKPIKASGAVGTSISTKAPKNVPEQKQHPQSRDCQRPECMSHGCFGHCMKDCK